MPYIPSGTELLNPFTVLEEVGLVEGMRVADLGCGAVGHFTFPAARLVGPKGKVYAVDILRSVLTSIEGKIKMEEVTNVETVWTNLEVYGGAKIASDTLDAALFINTPPKEAILKESIRMIKKGGKLLAVNWKKTASPLGPPVEKRFSPDELKQIIVGLGLTLDKEFEAGKYHYGMVFVK